MQLPCDGALHFFFGVSEPRLRRHFGPFTIDARAGKVAQAHGAVFPQQNIAAAQVALDDALAVDVHDGARHLAAPPHTLGLRDLLALLGL
ncbi:uncharacterized protein SPSK_10153 [Sporothrix schenckii 1099-18]|uniref:Uncharacterized protein n=1 Tax=Sporothrix schenckii 1099-18 TaxID=1397361 RepID=A0A0F2M4Z2_SPOSC|nr:uncharacterized protein SPSK_10153 [Sporothrix schenckii 1099-18]KJR84159.1 hypothetical protein SPSK_10153 [Sporothrix schenckii 1099-18]